jgi:hypothetical protein
MLLAKKKAASAALVTNECENAGAFLDFRAKEIETRGWTCNPAPGLDYLHLPESERTVVAALARGGEPLWMPDLRRSQAPEPSAGGRRTHSPGSALPSLVLLLLSLGALS